ncbi:MAG TPA: hypothetical protein VL326_20270 [Kofleriaceae bacterium]|nr:hypothetical protein [Kofleriaceae bacterium]
MRTTLAVLVLSFVASCEKELPPAAAAPPEPAKAAVALVPPPPTPPQPELIHDPVPQKQTICVTPERRYKGIGIPPSVYPKKYLPWYASLCDDEREKVDNFCKQHELDFQVICGGIGVEHIPYPPYPRARVVDDPRDGVPPGVIVVYHSVEAWSRSLTPAQKAYEAAHCPMDESRPSSDLCGDNTPLVIAFANQAVEFVAGGAYDWPTTSTPWLVLDRDGNGTIDGEHELFGSSTVMADGYRAANGFIALAELDANHDGRIDAADPAFGKLQLWADADRDRHGTAEELTAASTSLVSISLENHVDLRCDTRGNCEGERATIEWRDQDGMHKGAVVDVYLPRR